MPAGWARPGAFLTVPIIPPFQRNSDIRLQQSLSTPSSAANDPAALLNGGGADVAGGGSRKDSEYRRFRSEGQFGEEVGAGYAGTGDCACDAFKGGQIGRRDLNEGMGGRRLAGVEMIVNCACVSK